jgi:hypothetical protein
VSEWHEAGEDEIEISEDGKTLDVLVKQNDNDNVYVELPIDIVRKKLLNVPDGHNLNDVLDDVLAEFQKYGHTSPEKFEMTWDTLKKILSKYFS